MRSARRWSPGSFLLDPMAGSLNQTETMTDWSPQRPSPVPAWLGSMLRYQFSAPVKPSFANASVYAAMSSSDSQHLAERVRGLAFQFRLGDTGFPEVDLIEVVAERGPHTILWLDVAPRPERNAQGGDPAHEIRPALGNTPRHWRTPVVADHHRIGRAEGIDQPDGVATRWWILYSSTDDGRSVFG